MRPKSKAQTRHCPTETNRPLTRIVSLADWFAYNRSWRKMESPGMSFPRSSSKGGLFPGWIATLLRPYAGVVLRSTVPARALVR
jgi:hypothetical protein